MKVKILSKKGNQIEFLLDGVTPAFANALRRIMISEIPTLAIDWINMRDNPSVLFDEVLAHRLSLIPLQFDPVKLRFTSECKCKGKGCSLCQVVFTLDKKGPCMVYSGDLKSSNPEVKPVDPKIPIVELLNDQNVKLEAIAKLGLGTQHARYQAANASYQYYPELEVTACKHYKKVIESCPKHLLALKGKKLILTDPTKCDLCRSCEEASTGLKIKGNDRKFIFRVESISGLKPEYIINNAAEILQSKAQAFKKELGKI